MRLSFVWQLKDRSLKELREAAVGPVLRGWLQTFCRRPSIDFSPWVRRATKRLPSSRTYSFTFIFKSKKDLSNELIVSF